MLDGRGWDGLGFAVVFIVLVVSAVNVRRTWHALALLMIIFAVVYGVAFLHVGNS